MKIKLLRLNLNKTQKEVAEELNMPRTKFARIETGESNPDVETIIKIANYFKVSIDYLLENELYGNPAGEYYQLTEKQKEIIPLLKNLNKENINRLEAYAYGLLDGQKEHENKVRKILGE